MTSSSLADVGSATAPLQLRRALPNLAGQGSTAVLPAARHRGGACRGRSALGPRAGRAARVVGCVISGALPGTQADAAGRSSSLRLSSSHPPPQWRPSPAVARSATPTIDPVSALMVLPPTRSDPGEPGPGFNMAVGRPAECETRRR